MILNQKTLLKEQQMNNNHATLSPSNAEKWSKCPGSIQLEIQAVAESPGSGYSNIYADTGTLAHMMGELCLTYNINTDQLLDMQQNVQLYIDYVRQFKSPTSRWLIEERIDIFNACWGTADAVVIDREQLHVIDLKYGKSVVKAEDNNQMLLYAYGMLKTLPHVRRVSLHIVMPRGKNSQWDVRREDVMKRGEQLELKGKQALDPDNLTLIPAPSSCQWCKAKYICPARVDDRARDFDLC